MDHDWGLSGGDVIAERYTLVRHIGGGAFGQVWEADDGVGKRRVALKLLRPDSGKKLARIQLEVAALRLRLPGIVELYDSGTHGEHPYIAMELVAGSPFPGRALPCRWSELASPTMALLETLARIHAESYVHRDLKPANVLITAEGQPRILDFGFALLTTGARDEDLRITQDSELAGTPAYIAPEQIQGEASEQSDLYAVGVMLYEALSGRLPHEGKTLPQLLYARMHMRPRPLADLVPDLPPKVAQVIDQLLESDAAKRPPTAAVVLGRLRGELLAAAPFPWLGPQDHLVALVEATRAGRSTDIVGPAGSGKTRCIQMLEQALERGGGERRTVILTSPGDSAFSSLSGFLGAPAEHAGRTLAEVTAFVGERVRAALARGEVILADDAERIDPCSARVLEEHRDAGAVVRCFTTGELPLPPSDLRLSLSPLREEDLRSLFAGPDRLFHLREDAARILHRRTGGLPARLVREVGAWLGLGFARWDRDLLVMARATLDLIETGLWAAEPVETDRHLLQALRGSLQDTLVWIALAWPHADVDRLALAMEQPRFRVEADVAELVERKLVGRSEGGALDLRLSLSPPDLWGPERLREARAAVAAVLPAGTPRRLMHLQLSGTASEAAQLAVGAEAAALAKRHIDEGRPAYAVITVEHGLRGIASLPPELAMTTRMLLLGLWLEAAVAEGSPHALDRALYALCLVEPPTQEVAALVALGHAALSLNEFSDRPLGLINDIRPFADSRLERVRLMVRMRAVRRTRNHSLEETVLDEIEAAAAGSDPGLLAAVQTARGTLRYAQGRYREAAGLHAVVARTAPSRLTRIHSATVGALSLIEAFALDEAQELLRTAWDLLASIRHPHHEALASWAQRTILYRKGESLRPDLELVAAGGRVGDPQLEGLLYLNEAAAAYRSGSTLARVLANRAHSCLSGCGAIPGALLMRCLAAALGEPMNEAEEADLCARARGKLPNGIGIQMLGLLALRLHEQGKRLPEAAVDAQTLSALVASLPREHWDVRMDVLSTSEALTALRRAP